MSHSAASGSFSRVHPGSLLDHSGTVTGSFRCLIWHGWPWRLRPQSAKNMTKMCRAVRPAVLSTVLFPPSNVTIAGRSSRYNRSVSSAGSWLSKDSLDWARIIPGPFRKLWELGQMGMYIGNGASVFKLGQINEDHISAHRSEKWRGFQH